MSREHLAVAAGVSSRTVARAELAEAHPHPVVVAALAAALGVDVDALVNANGPAANGAAARTGETAPDACRD